ncbi:MAG: PEPxxWA-CTERM sorting domain-containing protein [Polymorphobacter sp.]
MTISRAAVLGATLFAGIAVQAQAVLPFTVSLESENPGAQNSTSGFFSVGVEDFNARNNGEPQNFNTSFDGSVFSGVYTGVGVNNADQYGGADGTGKYANAQSNNTYTLDLTSSEPGGVTYFGFWLSALDGNNNVSFYQGGNLLFTYTAANAAAFINGLPNSGDYRGNPNANFLNQNDGEPYSFLNFYARGGTRFDQVVFSQGSSGGYESDNHTVGRWSRMSGTIIGGNMDVPEPATWAMLVTGFGLVGFSARRRRNTAIAA